MQEELYSGISSSETCKYEKKNKNNPPTRAWAMALPLHFTWETREKAE